MFKFIFMGTRTEFKNRLEEFKNAKKEFPKTIGIPAPTEILEIMHIVNKNLNDQDFEFKTNEEIKEEIKKKKEELLSKNPEEKGKE